MSWEATSLRFRILAALAIAAAMAALLELRPSVRLAARQRALLEWAQSGGPRAFVEEFDAEGRDVGGVAKWVTKEQLESKTPAPPPDVRPTLTKAVPIPKKE